MASRYWVGGSGTWNSSNTTNWSATSGGSGGASVPTSADDVFLNASSTGTVTLSASSVCRNLNCTGFTGTITHPAAVTITISGSLTLSSGMTYTLGNAATSAITFTSTSTGNTITTAGKVLGNITFNGAGGAWTLQDNLAATGGTITLTAGSWDTGSKSVSAASFSSANSTVRTLTLGSSALTFSAASPGWTTSTNTNLTVTSNSAVVTFTGTSANLLFGSGKNWNGMSIALTGSGSPIINGANCVFANVTRTGTAVKTDGLFISADFTVTGTLALNGNSSVNRIGVTSNATGTQRTITNAGATMSWSNADFQDIALTSPYDASAIPGGSGDCGGNTGITFTAPATQTWSGTASGSWSSNAWTSRMPLPQDDVIISSAFSPSGRVITVDVPRMGASIDFTGTSGNPALTFTAGVTSTVFGSLTLVSTMTLANINTTLQFSGRGSYTLTSAGQMIYPTVAINAPGGSVTLQDALTAGRSLTVTIGTLTTNNYSVTVLTALTLNSSAGAYLNLGSSTITLTGTGAIWNTQTNGTLNAGTSNVVLSNSTATAKSFTSSGTKAYATVTFSGDSITINNAGTCYIDTLAVSTAGLATGLKLTSGQSVSIGALTSNGSAGNLAKLSASTAGSASTLTSSSGQVVVDYMSIQDVAVGGSATWYAGSHSVDVSGNSGWTWTDAAGAILQLVLSAVGLSSSVAALLARSRISASSGGLSSSSALPKRRSRVLASAVSQSAVASIPRKRSKLTASALGAGASSVLLSLSGITTLLLTASSAGLSAASALLRKRSRISTASTGLSTVASALRRRSRLLAAAAARALGILRIGAAQSSIDNLLTFTKPIGIRSFAIDKNRRTFTKPKVQRLFRKGNG